MAETTMARSVPIGAAGEVSTSGVTWSAIIAGGVAAAAIALILLAPWMLATLNLDTRLWVADDTQEDQDSDDATEAEALLYDQPSRIAAAVERVAPNTGKKPAVFFVGFAGDGDESAGANGTLTRCDRTDHWRREGTPGPEGVEVTVAPACYEELTRRDRC